MSIAPVTASVFADVWMLAADGTAEAMIAVTSPAASMGAVSH
jgi:hypothetical protein